MRTILMTLTVFVMTMSIAVAQAPAKDGKGPRPSKAEMVEKLKTDLDLNDEQVEKLTALHEKHMAEREALKAEGQEYKDKRHEMREKHMTEMKEILTDEQYDKLLKLRDQRKLEHHGSGQGKGVQPHKCSGDCGHHKK